MGALTPEARAKRKREWRARNRAAVSRSEKAWRDNHKDSVAAQNRRWREKHPDEVKANNDRARLRKYGLTSQAQWDAIFDGQGRRCACCGTDAPGSKWWHTDHDHVTNVLRGILCHSCNITLGFLGDNAIAVRETCDRYLRYLSVPR